MSEKTLFPERMREARLKSGLSQAELSRRTNISPATLSTYESVENPKNPPIDKAIAIAKALNVSLDWLCGQETKDETMSDELTVESVLNAIITLSKLRDCEIQVHYENDFGEYTTRPYITISIDNINLCNFAEEYRKINDFMKNPDYADYLKLGLKNTLLNKFISNYIIIDGWFQIDNNIVEKQIFEAFKASETD